MNELFAKIYLDEDINILVGEIVRSRGFEVLTVTEAERKGESDEEQLKFAAKNKYVILTQNRVDFEKLAQEYFAGNKTHYGIMITVHRSPQEIAQRLSAILNNISKMK